MVTRYNLLPAQLADLVQVQSYCADLNTELVIIGAVAFQIYFPSEDRFTSDIDLAVALELNNFQRLKSKLLSDGWVAFRRREHRWQSNAGSLFDLLPAGPILRAHKQIVWPESGNEMSLVGFDYVFTKSKPIRLNQSLTINVVEPIVLLFLKIVAFMENQEVRAKDLLDIRAILSLYEGENEERLFSAQIFDAELSDIKWASAYLAGGDLRALITTPERDIVISFMQSLLVGSNVWHRFRESALLLDDRSEEAARAQLSAFAQGMELLL